MYKEKGKAHLPVHNQLLLYCNVKHGESLPVGDNVVVRHRHMSRVCNVFKGHLPSYRDFASRFPEDNWQIPTCHYGPPSRTGRRGETRPPVSAEPTHTLI